jgi:hypothetical protein
MVMWVFLKLFLEEHDNGIDLMTKIILISFWHLKDKIKTPVHCQLALQLKQLLDICLVWRFSPIEEGLNVF